MPSFRTKALTLGRSTAACPSGTGRTSLSRFVLGRIFVYPTMPRSLCRPRGAQRRRVSQAANAAGLTQHVSHLYDREGQTPTNQYTVSTSSGRVRTLGSLRRKSHSHPIHSVQYRGEIAGDPIANAILQDLAILEQDQSHDARECQAASSAMRVSPWLQLTRWAAYLCGRDLKMTTVPLSRPDQSPEHALFCLCERVDRLVHELQQVNIRR